MGTGAEFKTAIVDLAINPENSGACPHILPRHIFAPFIRRNNLGTGPGFSVGLLQLRSPNYLRSDSWTRKLLKKD